MLARMAAIGQEHVVVVDAADMRPALFRQEHVVEADPVARRIDVQLADRESLVARVVEGPGECRQVVEPDGGTSPTAARLPSLKGFTEWSGI